MVQEAGRDPADVPVTLWGAPPDADRLRRYQDAGIARVIVSLESASRETVLPELDRWTKVMRALQ